MAHSGQKIETFRYDPLGRRIEKSSSATTSVFAYDGDNMIEETNSAGGKSFEAGLKFRVAHAYVFKRGDLDWFLLSAVSSLAKIVT